MRFASKDFFTARETHRGWSGKKRSRSKLKEIPKIGQEPSTFLNLAHFRLWRRCPDFAEYQRLRYVGLKFQLPKFSSSKANRACDVATNNANYRR